MLLDQPMKNKTKPIEAESIEKIHEIIDALTFCAEHPSERTTAFLRASASDLLKISVGADLAAIEGRSFRAGLNHQPQPDFNPL